LHGPYSKGWSTVCQLHIKYPVEPYSVGLVKIQLERSNKNEYDTIEHDYRATIANDT